MTEWGDIIIEWGRVRREMARGAAQRGRNIDRGMHEHVANQKCIGFREPRINLILCLLYYCTYTNIPTLHTVRASSI